ncbi:MAG: hypothetical protein U1E53_20055 [Dongiaceae bacterium]
MTSILVRARAALFGLVLLLACVSPAAADDALPEVEGSFAMLGMQVPLPGGPWHLVAEAQQPAPAGRPVLHGAVLASLSGTTVAGLVVIQAAIDSEAVGSGLPGACSRSDLHWTEIRSGAGSLLAVCSYVTHLVHAAGPGSAAVWTAADRAIRSQGWTVPATWLAVGFRIADDIDLLDVRYYFNPDLLGMPPVAARAEPAGGGWLGGAASIYGSVRAAIAGEGVPHDPRWVASPWSPAAVADDPRRAAAIAGLVAWAHPALRALRSGFAGRAAAMLPPPAPWSAAAQGGAKAWPRRPPRRRGEARSRCGRP